MLSETFFRATNVTAVIESLAEYSMTFDSSYKAYFHKVCVTDTAGDSVLCGSIQDVSESSYRHYLRATNLIGRFADAL